MTLWRLLERYHVPTFIYVNKMDLPGADKALRLRELRGRFGDGCVDFTPTVPAEERAEALGVCSEPLMEAVLATGTVPQADLITAITRRQVFPCYFGAALRLDGIDDLLNGLQRDTRMPPDAGSFGARIFKIGADESGARMTYLKVTDGVLKVKSNLVSRRPAAGLLRQQIPPGQRSPGGHRLCGAGPHKNLSRTGPWRTAGCPPADAGTGAELPGGAAGRS